jgi:hypothetical protein
MTEATSSGPAEWNADPPASRATHDAARPCRPQRAVPAALTGNGRSASRFPCRWPNSGGRHGIRLRRFAHSPARGPQGDCPAGAVTFLDDDWLAGSPQSKMPQNSEAKSEVSDVAGLGEMGLMPIQFRASALVAWLSLVLVGCGGNSSPSPAPPGGVPTPPTVTLSPASANVFVGQPVLLTWSSTNTTSCTESGGWNGSEPTGGSQSVTATVAGMQTYSIACTGSGGTASASATIAATTASLSLANTFSPNGATISTSEGAPYGDADMWLGPRGFTVQSAYGYGPTKVIRLYICLSGQVAVNNCSQPPAVTGPLSAQMLAGIDAGIAFYAGTGTRLLIRFTYNFGPTSGPAARDAPIDVISTHIDQLAPILLKNRDLIFGFEAGFIGTWGEWHDSTNGNDTTAAHKVVLDKELSYFNGVFPILVRDPGDLLTYAGTSTPPAGLGLHDDYYASSPDDGGTFNPCVQQWGWCLSNYTAAQLMAYSAQVSTASMFVGEFGAMYPVGQSCPALDAYSYEFNVQSIALADISPYVPNDGCTASFLNKVGTRIELQQAMIIGNPTAGGTLFVAVTLVNAGYGRVVRARPVTLVLSSNGSVVGQVPISLQDLDLRQLVSSSPAVPTTFQFNVMLPSNLPSGRPISIALSIPDPAPSLSPQPAYALPLNSVDQTGRAVFNSTTGYNIIGSLTSGSSSQSNNLVLRLPRVSSPTLELTGSWAGDGPVGPLQSRFMPTQVIPSSVRAAVDRLHGTPRITWTLSQSGTSVTGTAAVTLQGSTLLQGALTGTYVNRALTYLVTVPAGAAPIAPRCSGQIEGVVSATSTMLVGSASLRTSTCNAPISAVTFTLSRQ